MSLFESIETSTGVPEAGAVPPAMRRAALLEHPTLAVAAIEKGRIRETNASWKTLFALPPDVSVESHVATLFPNVTSADRFEAALAAELAGAEGSSVRIEHLMMRRDGNAFLAEIVVCLFGAHGERALGGDAVWQVRDITVERTLRRELRDLEEYHRELSRHQWDVTFVIDRKGRIAYASSSIEGVLGYRVNTILGEPFTALIDPAHAAAAEQWLRAASRHQPKADATQSGDGFPLRVLHADGPVRVLACRPRDCFAIPRIAGMVVHARDVTAVVQDDQVADLAAAEAGSLRAALIELARVPSPTLDERIDVLLQAVCERLGASSVTFWKSEGDGWQPRPLRCGGAPSKTGQVDDGVPLLSAANASSVSMPLIVRDIARDPSIAVETVPFLRAASVGALIEVPVLDEGAVLGWLTVAAAEARDWPDAEVGFAIGSALLVALAIKGHARPPVVERPVTAAATDALTGLPRRGDAERHLAARIAAVGAEGVLAVLVVDLDRLQDVNDVLGLAGGDAAIRRVATALVEVAGPEAYVARIDGDEFLVVVEGADGRQVDALAEAILERIAGPTEGGHDAEPVGASIGVARMTFDDADPATLLLHADLAMREAKHRGRGQAFVFNARLAASLNTRKELDAEIEDALARDEFTIFYQPQVALATGEVVALEALLRWQHPTRGLLLPDAFIASAFKRGLIDAITKTALTHVLRTTRGVATPRDPAGASGGRQRVRQTVPRPALAGDGRVGADEERPAREAPRDRDHRTEPDRRRRGHRARRQGDVAARRADRDQRLQRGARVVQGAAATERLADQARRRLREGAAEGRGERHLRRRLRRSRPPAEVPGRRRGRGDAGAVRTLARDRLWSRSGLLPRGADVRRRDTVVPRIEPQEPHSLKANLLGCAATRRLCSMAFENIRTETRGRVGLITLHRPAALNALNDALMDELTVALRRYDGDEAIGCIVLTGGDKVFAAGADVMAMASWTYMDVYKSNFITRNWETIRSVRKPVIAAVAGYALGGGCELAMMCDIVIASEDAKFGQPEVKLGIIPGAGGTQRLPRAVGKAKAMDLCLTARMMDASEAERSGLVSRVVASARLLDEALEAAEKIASFSQPIVSMIKESVNRSYESSLSEGVLFERRAFHSTFGTEDQKEGMAAFSAKRRPHFKNS